MEVLLQLLLQELMRRGQVAAPVVDHLQDVEVTRVVLLVPPLLLRGQTLYEKDEYNHAIVRGHLDT